jgi:glycosyltransferase involved in cell wall biosynthesis
MTVRRLVPKTGIRYAVLAVPRCVALIPKFRLCVVGAGPERANLEALAADLGVRDRICFVGAVDNARVPLYMRAADLGVFPSLAEATSIAALEFMAAGTPVTASSVGGLVEIIDDGIDGFLFDFGFSRSRYDDPGLPDEAVEAVAASIVRAYRSDLTSIGHEAVRRVHERHTWDSYAHRLEHEYYSNALLTK